MGSKLGITLVAALLSWTAPVDDERAAGPTGEPAPSWARITADAVALRVRERHEDVRCEVHEVLLLGTEETDAWSSSGEAPALLLRLFLAAAPRHRIEFLVTPWRRMSWRGSALAQPRVFTISDTTMVIGPLGKSEQQVEEDEFGRDMVALMQDLLGTAPTERGARTLLEDETLLIEAPHSLHLVQQVPPAVAAATTVNFLHEQNWAWVNEQRALVVEIVHENDAGTPSATDDSYRRLEIYPPLPLVRDRPVRAARGKQRDRGEQQLAPGVDLAAASEQLDEDLRRLYGSVLHDRLARDVAADEPLDPETLEALRTVVFAHPAHSGPAHAAGQAVFARALDDLRQLLSPGRMPAQDPDFWPSTLTAFDPAVLKRLPLLPPPRSDRITSLATEWVHRQREAAAAPGVWSNALSPADRARLGIERVYRPTLPELMLAELGDRIRHVARTDGSQLVRIALREAGVERDDRTYRAFRFAVSGPNPGDDRYVVGIVTLSLDLR